MAATPYSIETATTLRLKTTNVVKTGCQINRKQELFVMCRIHKLSLKNLVKDFSLVHVSSQTSRR
jgi:hypothetical protein